MIPKPHPQDHGCPVSGLYALLGQHCNGLVGLFVQVVGRPGAAGVGALDGTGSIAPGILQGLSIHGWVTAVGVRAIPAMW